MSSYVCVLLTIRILRWGSMGIEKRVVTTPLWEECEDETYTPELGTWGSTGTLETSEFDCKGQNTLHCDVLYIIGKLSKRRCRKWVRMSHLDICNTSYGKKKGRESNWQFDSRPRCVQVKWDTPLESFWRELQVCFRPHPNPRFEQKIMTPQNGRSPNRDNFETPPWESRDKKPFGCRCRGEAQRILHGGRWWLPPNPGCGESCESKVASGLS
jgi:hypothetical protein